MKQLIEAICNHDKSALKKMFSERAISEVDDIDGNINSFFELFQDKDMSWEGNSGPAVYDTNDYEVKTKEAGDEGRG